MSDDDVRVARTRGIGQFLDEGRELTRVVEPQQRKARTMAPSLGRNGFPWVQPRDAAHAAQIAKAARDTQDAINEEKRTHRDSLERAHRARG